MSLDYLPKPGSIPAGGIDSNINCSDCLAVCCRKGVALPLARKERQGLRSAGTELTEMSEQESPKLGIVNKLGGAAYCLLNTDCGHLTPDGKCVVWDSDDQPKACKRFPMGGAVCAMMRLKYAENTKQNSPEAD